MAKNTWADLDTTTANNQDVLGQSALGTADANQLDAVDRSTLALMARGYADWGGVVTVGGSANAITITSASTYQALESGIILGFKASSANTAAATLNLDSLGAKAIRRKGDTALSAGDIAANGRYQVVYDAAYNSSAGAWVLLNPELGSSLTTLQTAFTSASASGPASLAFAEDTDNGSNKATVSAPSALSGDIAITLPSSAGTLALTSDAASDLQEFTSSGTWNKPSKGTVAFIECWGAGGSGGKGNDSNAGAGGGGGGYSSRWMKLSAITSTVTVTIGSGGAARSGSNTAGAVGGNTTFGAYLTGYGGGGGGGAGGNGGGGGGTGSAGSTGTGGNDIAGGSGGAAGNPGGQSVYGGGGGGTGGGGFAMGGAGVFGGGGGGANGATTGDPGASGGGSGWGGGGGGCGGRTVDGGDGGASAYGGAGGKGAVDSGNAVAGTQPGGGGGGSENGNSGAGADGMVRVTVI